MGDQSLEELSEEDPIGVMSAILGVVNKEAKTSGSEGVAEFARGLADDEGINVFRMMNEEPEITRRATVLDPPFDDELVESIDERIDD